MKLSTLSPVVAMCIIGCIALPARIQTSIPSQVSQDPSPPRPFPAGRIVEVKDPSPPRPFPKYPLEGGNPLEERDPSALSRFPTDEESVAHDPSPPRPFPAGRIVDVENPSPPLDERDPSAPHKLVALQTAASDPSPPRPFPKYPLDGGEPLDEGNPLEERDPLSRFPTDGEEEAADPSPPRPFPAGRIVEEGNPSPSAIIEPRSPSPLLRNTEGSEAEANDPSPPRPFPAGRVVDTKDPSSSHAIESRSPSPLLRNADGSEAEANDPSPPRPFPAGHPMDIEPRAEEPPTHRGHGGYFPPSNPPVSEPSAPAMEADRMKQGPHTLCPHRYPSHDLDYCQKGADDSTRRPHRDPVPIATIFNPTPTSSDSAPRQTPLPSQKHHAQLCTTTYTSVNFHHPNITGTSTVYNATVTLAQYLECRGCVLTVTRVDIGNGPPVETSRPTVTDLGTTTEYAAICSPTFL